MTAPRQIIAGRTYLVSRRCTQRQFLLRPDAYVNQLYLYCVAEAVARFGVTLHGCIAMGNHHHLIVRDNDGNLPAFLEHLHKMLAKAMNCHRRRWENFWAAEQPNAVYLVEDSDRFDKLVYLHANPVADHLVDRVADWPGATSLALALSGCEQHIDRPRGYFREDGPMPDQVVLRIERPDGFAHLDDAEWRETLRVALDRAERDARLARRQSGRGILGRKAVLRVDTNDRPQSVEARGGLRPGVACANRSRRQLELALLRGFRAAYRAALSLWCGGERAAGFPAGTYAMRSFGVRVAPYIAGAAA